MRASKETWIRTMVLILTLLNQILNVCGINPLPFSEEQAYEGFSMALATLASLWTWWKNNSFTKAAVEADEILKSKREAQKNG